MSFDSTTEELANERRVLRQKLPETVSSLRQKLYQKARTEPKFRFYALYDRIFRKDVLAAAWEGVRKNRGAPGVDGQTIDQIAGQEGGPSKLIDALHDELRSKTYKPQPVQRKYILKPNGKLRPLGIPTVRDRVVQQAARLILEPIFEADFLDCSHGFRPGRSAKDALEEVRLQLKEGRRSVYDADLKGYFDSIPHDKLLEALKMRIADRSVLNLLMLWLKTPIVEKDEDEGSSKMTYPTCGTPQGGVISPLLSNVYLHWFDKFFHSEEGPRNTANARLVRYADDFLVLARRIGDSLKTWIEETLEKRMGLVVNREKTKIVELSMKSKVGLDFLGYTYRYCRDLGGRPHSYLNMSPSTGALFREYEALRKILNAKTTYMSVPMLVHRVNRQVTGWLNYFNAGYPAMTRNKLARYLKNRFWTWLRRKSQRPWKLRGGQTAWELLSEIGLIDPRGKDWYVSLR